MQHSQWAGKSMKPNAIALCRATEPEIDLSVGTVGDAYDNALAKCVIGLFKTEVLLGD